MVENVCEGTSCQHNFSIVIYQLLDLFIGEAVILELTVCVCIYVILTEQVGSRQICSRRVWDHLSWYITPHEIWYLPATFCRNEQIDPNLFYIDKEQITSEREHLFTSRVNILTNVVTHPYSLRFQFAPTFRSIFGSFIQIFAILDT